MAKIKARNARMVADYITVKKLSAADKKMLDRFKSRLIVQDGMKVEPFTEKIEIEYDKKYKNQIPNLADYLANVFLEDDVVVQSEGAPQNLMESIPIEIDEIETLMNK